MTVSELYTDKRKDDLVVDETRGNRQMISQILNSTFNCHGAVDRRITCPPGPEVISAKIENFKKVVFTCDINKVSCKEISDNSIFILEKKNNPHFNFYAVAF